MAVTISIPNKSTGGSLNRTTMKFTPNGANATAVSVTGTWPSFAFTLSASDGDFPAGTYSFTGHLNTSSNPCTATGAIACGTVTWPSAEGDEPGWEATGGPEPEDEAEEPSADT
ncbi:MAG: hypothetical protein H0V18_06265 [Pyrinomonadaceae bacterium]|nr:hypothetical protein [Pyrinomonadaceae bacterium]